MDLEGRELGSVEDMTVGGVDCRTVCCKPWIALFGIEIGQLGSPSNCDFVPSSDIH